MLSFRLKTIRNLYSSSQVVWDIGCDHGLLGASFSNSSEVAEIYLVDPSPEVIKNLKSIDSYITNPKFHILQKKGQEIQTNKEKINCLFIAGMGGGEIQNILEGLVLQLNPSDSVIISPHRKILELRSYLIHSPYRLKEETLVSENQQFYQILSLRIDPHLEVVSPFGSSQIWDSSLGKEYASYHLSNFMKHKDLNSKNYVKFLKALV
jgi:tRNA (adenine22-N1)-methyltransferase